MKALTFFLITNLYFIGTFSTKDCDISYIKEWNEFKTTYDKPYKDNRKKSDEELRRYEIFKSNMKDICIHNLKYKDGKETYEMDINEFTDMNFSEIQKKMLGFNGSILKKDIKQVKFKCIRKLICKWFHIWCPKRKPKTTPKPIPTEVDWVKRGAVTQVKHQGSCGASWAFSIAGTLEGQVFQKHGKLISLSAQNLIDCTYGKYFCNGCKDGYTSGALQYVIANKGIDTDKSYPYEGKYSHKCKYKTSTIGATCKSYKVLNSFNENLLKEAVAKIGPISVAVQVTENFRHYKQGILYDSFCSKFINRTNHAMLVVGYGTDKATGSDYWLVKNSWGPKWGRLNGYIKMARNRNNNCNIATYGIYPDI